MVFGLTATLKRSITVKEGRIEQSHFDEFPLLRMDEVPQVDVFILDSQAPPSGIGEVGVPSIAPTVTNALYVATGIWERSLPVEPDYFTQLSSLSSGTL